MKSGKKPNEMIASKASLDTRGIMMNTQSNRSAFTHTNASSTWLLGKEQKPSNISTS